MSAGEKAGHPAWTLLRVMACVCLSMWLVPFGPGALAEGAPHGETRLALVIGNGDYPAAPLATAVTDAGLVAQTLAQAGFEVTAAADADGSTIRKLFDDFAAKLQAAGPGSVAFVYLAGYGLQFDGDNLFVPSDAKINRDSDVTGQAVSLSNLAKALQATPARTRMFVYDLARTAPFARAGMPLAPGLNIPAAADGSLTAINASPGTVAEPDFAPYGTYARALAEMIQAPGLQADTLFRRVRLRVVERTGGAQVPFDVGHSDFAFYPTGDASSATVPDAPITSGMPLADAFAATISRDTMAAFNEFIRAEPNEPLLMRVRRMMAARLEALMWNESLLADTPRADWTYMRRYPRGPHFGDARRRLAQLNAALEPPPRFDVYDYVDLPPPLPDELAMLEQQDAGGEVASIPPVPVSVPVSVLPPLRDAVAEDLPPPPVLPEHVLPIPVPIVRPAGANAPEAFGTIVQPYVAGGSVTTSTRNTTVVAKSRGTLLSQTSKTIERGTRTLLQTGEGGEVITRTATAYDHGTIVTVQRGPSGRVLSETVTRTDPDGTRFTTFLDGQSRLVGQLRASGSGNTKAVEQGLVPAAEQILVLSPTGGGGSSPAVITLAQVQASATPSSKEQAAGARAAPPNAPALPKSSASVPKPTPPVGPSTTPASGDTVASKSTMPLPAPAPAGTQANSPAGVTPKTVAPVQTGTVDHPPQASVPLPSPTGGATLSAMPPVLRPSTSPSSSANLPGVAASKPSPQPPLLPSSASSSPPAAAPPAVIKPIAPAPAEKGSTSAPPTGRAQTPAGAPDSSRAPVKDTPAKPPAPATLQPTAPQPLIPPTEAPPLRAGPLAIAPDMLLPSTRLPSGFQPPQPEPLRAQQPSPPTQQQPAFAPPPSPQPSAGASANAPLPTETPMPPRRPSTDEKGQPQKQPPADKHRDATGPTHHRPSR